MAALKTSLQKHILAATCFIGVAVGVTWPLVTALDSSVIGHPETTAGCHVWVLWWAQQVFEGTHTDFIFFPHGADVVSLYGSDLLSPLVWSLVPVPPVVAYNIWVLSLLVAGALGARALACTVGATAVGGFTAGVVFMVAPFFQHEMLNGTSELLAAAALPWVVCLLWRWLDQPSYRGAALLGAVASVGVLASVYNGFFLLVMGGCVLAHRFATTAEAVLGPAHARTGGLAAAVVGVLLGPALVLHLRRGAAATISARADWRDMDPPLPDSFADLSDWFDPSAAVLPAQLSTPGGETFSYWTTCTVFLGFVACALAGWGVWRSRSARIRATEGRVVTPFVLMMIVGILFASGPVARLSGNEVTLLGQALVMPLNTLAMLVPPFDLTGLHAYRYAAVTVTALSVLVGLGARHLIWVPLLITEAIWFSPTPWPAPTTPHTESQVLTYLHEEPSEGAVLTVPTRAEDLHDLGRALLAQTVHGRPIQDGGIHRRAGDDATALFDDVLMVGRQAEMTPRFVADTQARFDLNLLHQTGFRWLLVAADEDEAVEWAQQLLGHPIRADSSWLLWSVPAAADPKDRHDP